MANKEFNFRIVTMGTITDIEGVRVGHASDFNIVTGCTVIMFDNPCAGAVDLRGGGTSTRQIDSLLSHNTLGKINAILLTGGSAYGLDASSGVMKYLEQKKSGLDVGSGLVVPSVPTAVIFDLGIGNGRLRPNAEMGYQACVNSSSSAPEEGSVGAGTGATIGKVCGLNHATKGGIGTASHRFGNGAIVGVLVVVNAFGDIISPRTGKIIAGVRNSPSGTKFEGTVNLLKKGIQRKIEPRQNTTLAVVVTNAKFSKSELSRISTIAHTGLAKVVSPANTVADGDMVMSVSSGIMREDANLVGVVAADLIVEAIIKAVEKSRGLGGIPSLSSL